MRKSNILNYRGLYRLLSDTLDYAMAGNKVEHRFIVSKDPQQELNNHLNVKKHFKVGACHILQSNENNVIRVIFITDDVECEYSKLFSTYAERFSDSGNEVAFLESFNEEMLKRLYV